MKVDAIQFILALKLEIKKRERNKYNTIMLLFLKNFFYTTTHLSLLVHPVAFTVHIIS